jgi:uncharacterized protein YndB with AHSA1/START domain
MSSYRRELLIESPVVRVWELVGNPRRHPEWWPRVVEVDGLGEVVESAEFVQTTRSIGGENETTMKIDELEDLRQIHLRGLDTGTFANWRLTEAQGATFAELELGMAPTKASLRAFDLVIGRRYFRTWSEQAIEGLRRASGQASQR